MMCCDVFCFIVSYYVVYGIAEVFEYYVVLCIVSTTTTTTIVLYCVMCCIEAVYCSEVLYCIVWCCTWIHDHQCVYSSHSGA